MKQRLRRWCAFLRGETVLCIAVVLAAASCAVVPPDAAYAGYIDWNTLAQLFSLMAVMQGLQQARFFERLAGWFLGCIRSTRTMLFVLVFLPFVFSMVVTNDVALIAFVPFGLTILRLAGQQRLAVAQVVLQTIAANLGSMLTPMGNPQNLYLYNASGLGFGAFCALTAPYVLASAAGLAAAILCIRPAALGPIALDAAPGSRRTLAWCAAGFGLCLLGVFKVVSPVAVALVVAAALLARGRALLAGVDYALLGTFLAFFLFVGNVSRLDSVRQFLSTALAGRVEAVSILASQVISNVPACLLLAGFTHDWRGLIIGCNFGGLGTMIASMASLISYKLLVKACPARRGAYLALFTALNLAFLAGLCLLYALAPGR